MAKRRHYDGGGEIKQVERSRFDPEILERAKKWQESGSPEQKVDEVIVTKATPRVASKTVQKTVYPANLDSQASVRESEPRPSRGMPPRSREDIPSEWDSNSPSNLDWNAVKRIPSPGSWDKKGPVGNILDALTGSEDSPKLKYKSGGKAKAKPKGSDWHGFGHGGKTGKTNHGF